MSAMQNEYVRKPAKSPYWREEHEVFRRTLRAFVEKEIAPFVNEWDEAGTFPRELYGKAGKIGLLGLGFPEELGGVPADSFFRIVVNDELARAGSGGVMASLLIHTIGTPPIVALAGDALKARVVPQILAGEKISCLAITEPSGGSDVANLLTTARREGDEFVVNGSKTFITSGIRADYYTVAVRTGGAGRRGISLLLIEKETAGFSQTPLKKMGWWCSDTATLYFDDCRVPAANLLGGEGEGFRGVMENFNGERFGIAAQCVAFARVCVDEAIAYARERVTFDRPLIGHQVIRHKIVDMEMRVKGCRAYLESIAWRLDQGEVPVAECCMLKNLATQCLEYCAGEAVQIFGGAGYMRGNEVERIYRETKVLSIGGGAVEIMKDLASRQMGL